MLAKLKNLPALANENGRMGYVIAWLFGVPASVLFFIFLIRGH
jgi:hypothetical protein